MTHGGEQRQEHGRVRPLRWIAHRGCASGRPWGTPTRQTLDMAIRLGVDIIEVDIRTTRDGQLVVRHDSISHGSDGAMSYRDIRMADPVILTLAEVDQAVAGRTKLLLDLKDSDGIEQLGRWLAAQPHPERYAVCTPVVADLIRLRELAPGVDRWITFPDLGTGGTRSVRRVLSAIGRRRQHGDFSRMARDLGRAIRDIRQDRSAAIAEFGSIPWRDALPEELPDLVARTGARGVSVHQWLVTPGLVSEAHRLGLEITAWTVNRPDALAAMIDAGSDYVTTDDVEGMRAHQPQISRMVEADRRRMDDRDLVGIARRLRRDGRAARGLPEPHDLFRSPGSHLNL